MPYRSWFAIPICLFLGISGCVKAVEKAPMPPAAPVWIELSGPLRPEIPRISDRLLRVDAADWTIPQIFLVVAGHFESKGERGSAPLSGQGGQAVRGEV